jgi:hypothetical protein
MSRYEFEPNILKLSHSQVIEVAVKEWYFVREERVPRKSERCVCNSCITVVNLYLNRITGHALYVGGGCKRKLKIATRENGTYTRDSDDIIINEPAIYEKITDMIMYSVAILSKMLIMISDNVKKTFDIEKLLAYKSQILVFPIDTSEVVQLINDKIQNCQAEIERERLERERQEGERQKYLQRQREIAAEQRRIMQEAARVAAEQEIDRKRQEAARRLIELQRENARKEAELHQQRIRDAEIKAERAALDLIREEKRRIERIEMEKIQAADRERIRIEQQRIAEERKKELNEQFDFYCKCKNAVYKKFNPHSDELRCKNCNKVKPFV